MKDKERIQELEEFNAKLEYELKTFVKPGPKAEMDELERRRLIMKNVKKEIDKDEAVAKAKQYDKNMSELEHKVAEKEAVKKKEEADRQEKEKRAADAKKANEDANSDFLGNLQTFKVE